MVNNIKRIGKESKLDDFLKGDIVEIEAPETLFSFQRGIYRPDKSTERGIIFERKDNSMLAVFKEQRDWSLPVIKIKNYCLSDEKRLMCDWMTYIQSYDSSYNYYEMFFRQANL